jgi:hypothetical protein
MPSGNCFGGDRKARRNRRARFGHLGKASTLAAQQITHRGIAFTEKVHVLFGHPQYSF